MPDLQELRWAYRAVFLFAVVLLGFEFFETSMAREVGGSGIASGDLGWVAILGVWAAMALRKIVQHIEVLEGELAKFVERRDIDRESAAQVLANFLRDVARRKDTPTPRIARAIGRFFRPVFGRRAGGTGEGG
jgi:hypothetical protein